MIKAKQLVDKEYIKEISPYGTKITVRMCNNTDNFYVFRATFVIPEMSTIDIPILESTDEKCKQILEEEPILRIMYTGSKYMTGDIILENDGINGIETLYRFD